MAKKKPLKSIHAVDIERQLPATLRTAKTSALLEALEPRVLFSADALGLPVLGLVDNDASLYDTSISDHTSNAIDAGTALEIIFLDPSLPQSSLILDDLNQQKSNGRNLEVVILSSDADGIDTITNALAGKSNVSSIHIISHGTDEGVQLGSTWLNNDAAGQYKSQLNQWQSSLSDDADMLIYGCNLAASADGIALLDTLTEQTKADIAASIDSTGHNNLGANWSLEYSSGAIETSSALTVEAQLSWENELAAVLAANPDDLGQQHYNTPFIVTDSSSFYGPHTGVPIDVTSNDTVDGGAIKLVNVLNENNGVVSEGPNNTFTFTPDTDHIGPASFDYIVSDDTGSLKHHWPLNDSVEDQTGNSNGVAYGELGNNGHVELPPIDYPDVFTLSFEIKLEKGTPADDIETFVDYGEIRTFNNNLILSPAIIWIGVIDHELITALKGKGDALFKPLIIDYTQLYDDGNWHTYTLAIDNDNGNSPAAEIYIDGDLQGELNVGAGGFNISENTLLGMTDDDENFPDYLNNHDMQNLRIYEGATSLDIETVTLDLQKHVGPGIDIIAPAIELDEDTSDSPVISINYTGDATDKLTATVAAQHGTLTFGPNPIPPGVNVTVQDSNQLSVNGTKTQIEDVLNSLVYTPEPNYHGSDTIEIQVDLGLEFQLDPAAVYEIDTNGYPTTLFIDDPDRSDVLSLENGEHVKAKDVYAGSQELTFSAWVNLDQASAGGAEVISIGDKAGLRLNYTHTNTDPGVFRGLTGFFHNEDQNDWVTLSHDIDLEDSGWRHVAYAVADGYQRLYLDGAIVAQSSFTASQDKDLIWFGGPYDQTKTYIGIHADTENNNFDFNGQIDDARFHSRLLSEDEIAVLADRATIPPSGANENLMVNIKAVNDAPTIRPETSSATFSETLDPNNSTPVVIHNNIEITDKESEFNTGGLNGASVTIQRADPDDKTVPLRNPFDSFFYKTVDLNNDITLDNTLVPGQAINGVDFVIVKSNSDGLLELEFNGNATTQNANEFLRNITYRNTSDAPPSTLDLLWTFNDKGLDNYGIPDTNAEEISNTLTFVNIATINHPLEVTTNNPLTVGYDTTTNILANTLETTDPESDASKIVYTFNGQTTTGNPQNVKGHLEIYNPDNATANILSPGNTFTQADINSGYIRYGSIADNSNPVTDEFRLSVKDEGGLNVQTTLTIDTGVLTDPPTLTPGPGQAAYTERTAPVIMDSGITVTDAELDAGNYDGATLSISRFDNINNLAIPNPDDQFSGNISNGGDLDLDNGNLLYAANNIGSYTTANGTLDLEFNASVNSIIANGVLRSITYSNTSNNPTPQSNDTETVYFQWQFSDESSTANAVTPIALSPINEAPGSNDITVNLNEDTEYSFKYSDFDFTDADADNLDSIIINTLPTAGQLLLSGNAVAPNQSIDIYAISNLRYVPVLNSVGTAIDSFTFQVQDDGETFNGGENTSITANHFTFNIASVNDAPTGSDNRLTTLEDTALPINASDFGFSDVDNNALLAVRIDALPSKGKLMLSNTELVAPQTISVADISNLEFVPEADASGSGYDTFSFTVQDNGGTANGGNDTANSSNTITIDVTSVNDAPMGTDNTVSGTEDTPIAFSPADFGFTDSDNNIFDELIIETAPINGVLALDGIPVMPAEKILVSDISKLSFTPQAEQYGVAYDTFEFSVKDNGGVNNGGLDTSANANVMTINIESVNDEPSGSDKTIGLLEDNPYIFATTDFGFTDPADNNNLTAVHIKSLPGYGVLTLNSTPVSVDQIITVADLSELVFTPASDAHGNNADNFTFAVQDNGGVNNNGVDTDTTPNQISFNVISVNDPPSGSNNTLTTLEDTTLAFSASDFGFSDDDGNIFQALQIDSLPANGQLRLSGAPVTAGQVIGIANIGFLEFIPTPNANQAGYDTFGFSVQDNGGTTNGGIDTALTSNTITIDVASINDAPSGADNTITALEDSNYQFGPSDFGFTDTDNNSLMSVIVEPPAKGQLTLAGVPLASSIEIQYADIANLQFVPQANLYGTAYSTFNFYVKDDGGVSDGGVDTSAVANVMTINIENVNDAPSGINKTVSILEDNTHDFNLTDFGFADFTDNNNLSAVHIKSLPISGELTLYNNPVSVNQIITASDIAALQFTPASDLHGTNSDHFTFAIQDDGGVDNGGIDTDPTANHITFDVISVNDQPMGSNNTLTTLEDTTLTFNASDFGFSDGDGNNFQALKIDTLPVNGQLLISGSLVTIGQVIGINNIGLLEFVPTPDANQTGYDSFSFSVQDDGGTDNGGIDTSLTSSTIKINVTSVNDAPSGTNNTVSTLEDSTYQFSPADFGFTDSDNNSFQSVILEPPANGQLTLAGMPLSSDTEIQHAEITNLQFVPQADQFGIAYSAFNFTVRDNGGISHGGEDTSAVANVMTINVASVNDAPSGTNNTITLLEDSTYAFRAADFGFTDPIDTDDSLSSITINTLPGNGTLKLADNSIVAINQKLDASQLSNLFFAPASNAHGSSYDDFTFTVQDNGGTANGGIDTDQNTKTITFDVLAINDAPDSTGSTIVTTEDTAYTFTALDFGFIDNTDNTDELHSIEITSLPLGQLLLSGSIVNTGQTITADSIKNLTYLPPSDANGAGIDSYTFLVRDNGGTLNGGTDTSPDDGTISVNVSSANDAPTSADGTVTGLEDTPYRFNATDFDFSDSDNNSIMSVFIDTLPDNGQLTLASKPVLPGQEIPVDSITDLAYIPLANQYGSAYTTFEFSVRDDGGIKNGGIDKSINANVMTINIASVNDAPVGQNNAIDILEDTTHTFSAGDFGFSDPLDNNTFSAVVITDLPSKGTLELLGVAVTAGQIIEASAIPDLQFVPEANVSESNYDSFAFQVQDDGGALNNGVNTDPLKNTITINVTPVNNAPAGSDNAVSTIEDTPYQFSGIDFGFSDPDGHQFLNLTITSLPTNGQLSHNGIVVTVGQVISASSVANLLYTPPSDGFGTGLDEFNFTVQDNGGVASNGIDSDPTPNTITIDVKSANDSPYGTDNTITINEDSRYPFSATDFGFSDPDGHDLQSITISALPNDGQLLLENVAVTANQVIAADSVTSLEFVPPANAYGNALSQFEFAVQDNGGLTNNGSDTDLTSNTITFDIISVNDAPSGRNKTVSTHEDTTLSFNVNDFGFNDIDGNTLESVRIDSLPGKGQLTFAGAPVALQQVIHHSQLSDLEFTPESAVSGNGYDTFSFAVLDNGGLSNNGDNTADTSNTITIDVQSVNDAPTSADNTVQGFEDTLFIFSPDDFAFVDADNHKLSAIIIESLPTSGQLSLGGNQVAVGDEIPYAAISELGFTPEPNQAGVAYNGFAFTVRDDGGTTNGGIDQSTADNNITIDITAVNDAPSGSDTTITVIEDTRRSFTAQDFGFTDPADNNSLLSVSISTLPDNGQLLLDNEALVEGQVIVASSIPSMVFVPAANANGIGYDSFTFQVRDDGGTDNGGRDFDNSANTISIDVIAQSDAPVGQDSAVEITDAQKYTLSRVDFDFTDIDNDSLAAIRIDSVPQLDAGQLLLNGQAVSIGTIIDITDIDAGNLVFIPTAVDDESEQSAFTYSLIDSGSTENNGQNTAIDSNELAFEISQAPPQFAPAFETAVLPTEAPAIENAQDTEEPTDTVISEEADAQALNENPEANANQDASFNNSADIPQIAALTDGLTGEPMTLQASSVTATIFRDFDLLSASIENHRTFNVESLTTDGAVIDVQESANLADLFYTEEKNTLASSNLLRKLSQERDQIEQDITLDAKVITNAVSVSTGLSIGYVIWLVRGGLLLGSVMSAMPAWRNVDPLPVLSSLDGDSDNEDDESLEDLVDTEDESDPEKHEHQQNKGQEN